MEEALNHSADGAASSTRLGYGKVPSTVECSLRLDFADYLIPRCCQLTVSLFTLAKQGFLVFRLSSLTVNSTDDERMEQAWSAAFEKLRQKARSLLYKPARSIACCLIDCLCVDDGETPER